MKYTVTWKPEAHRRLTELWTDAPDRAAISAATNEIDKRLGSNPLDEGESRDAGRRILLVSPLGVYFTVRDEDRLVMVIVVWRYPRRD